MAKDVFISHASRDAAIAAAVCAGLEARGVTLVQPYSRSEAGIGSAFVTDPWGTLIELTEGLRAL